MVKYEPIYETKICPICNEEYTLNVAIKRNREKKTCGKQKCASKYGNLNAKKVKVNCKICNTEFELSHFNVQKEGNYCSDECRKKRHQANCIVCGKLYFTDRLGTKYCSEECNAIGVKNQLKETICACCGKTFSRPSYTLPSNKRHFCSKRCSQRQFARENPNRYGSKWWRIRERKIKEDNYTCNRCGLQTYEKYALNVHHKIPIEEFDNVDDAHYPENLETLCFECHVKEHGRDILSDDYF